MKKLKENYNRLKVKIKNNLKNETFEKLKTLKNQIENGNKMKKFFINLCLIIIFIFIISYIVIFLIRFFIVLKFAFFEVFPHRAMSNNVFYEKYGYNLNTISFCSKLYHFWLDFITYNIHTIAFKVVLLILLFLIIYYFCFIFLKKIKQKIINENNTERFIVIKNTNITLNLCFYHFIINKMIEKMQVTGEYTFDDFKEVQSFVVENAVELYYIIKTQPVEELLFKVEDYKNKLLEYLKKNPDGIKKYAFDKMEKKFLNNLIEFLKNKQTNNDRMSLDFNDFVNKFSETKTDE